MSAPGPLAIVGQSAGASAMTHERTAVVLINVGTPDDPSTPAVRKYLREFLSDPRVLDINPIARWFLLRLIILPFRSPKSAAMYKTIWTERGSPLLVHSQDLAAKLTARLAPHKVFLAMRYGSPSFPSVVDEIHKGGYSRVILAPQFPQYASASTGTALAEAYRLLGKLPRVPDISVVPPFFCDDGFIQNVASGIVEATTTMKGERLTGVPDATLDVIVDDVDHLLLSYHSIPVHQVKNIHATCANSDACCATLTAANADCYRAQCVATTNALVAALRKRGFQKPVSTSFQSRLGRAEWLTPNTEHAIDALAKSGVKRLAIACPSFVADCLETVEEIGVRAREQFLAAGGQSLIAVPCVNSDDGFADTMARLISRESAGAHG